MSYNSSISEKHFRWSSKFYVKSTDGFAYLLDVTLWKHLWLKITSLILNNYKNTVRLTVGLKVLPVMMKETCRKAGYDLCLYKVYSREECTWKVYSYENESVENVSKKCILRRYVPWKCFSINMHGRWERTAIYLLHMFESCTLHFKSLPHSHYHQITLKRLKSQEV